MLSSRLPSHRTPNEWTRAAEARRAAGAHLLDLTVTNPTQVGLAIDPPHLTALADPRGASYDPAPRGMRTAREAVAALYAVNDARVDPDALVLTASTSEAYAHLFRLLADAGDAVAVPAPSYPLFEPLAEAESLRVAPYRLLFDGRWHLDTDSFARAIEDPRVRAAIVVQPNNPTGSCLPPEEIAFVRDACAARGIALVSDEVFADFPWAPDVSVLSSLRVAGDDPPLTFVLGGLSKSCGLPQMKLAWILVSGGAPGVRAEALDGLEWLADLFLSVGTPVQLALPSLLGPGVRGAFVTRARARIGANLATLAALTRERPALSLLPADGGWSAVLRVPRIASSDEWALALLERDVLVHPGHFYDFADDGHVVVSLLAEESVMREGADRLGALCAEWTRE